MASGTALIILDGRKRGEYQKIIRSKNWNNVHFFGSLDHSRIAEILSFGDLFYGGIHLTDVAPTCSIWGHGGLSAKSDGIRGPFF